MEVPAPAPVVIATYAHTAATTPIAARATMRNSDLADSTSTVTVRADTSEPLPHAETPESERHEEDHADCQNDGTTSGHEQAGRHREPADACQECDEDAPRQVAPRAVRHVACGRGGNHHERFDEQRTDDLEAHHDRQREQHGKE